MLRFVIAFLILLPLPVQADRFLLAGEDAPAFAAIRPMSNGLSSAAMVWPIPDRAIDAVQALRAGIWARLVAGDGTLSPADTLDYLAEHEIQLSVWARNGNVTLQMSAPHDVFLEAVDWLAAVLRNPDWTHGAYLRELARVEQVPASKLRRPDDVLNALIDQTMFLAPGQGSGALGPLDQLELQLGMPIQMMVRTEIEDVEALARTLAYDLPVKRGAAPQTGPMDASAFGAGKVIYIPDPDSTEMLVMMVTRTRFDDATEMQEARMLFDFMGLHQGSEMFRILRQERRMAYDPRSDIERLDRDLQLMSLSATVAADRWPEALDLMRGIYGRTRAGETDLQGMETTISRVTRQVNGSFATRSGWFSDHFMDEYPLGTGGQIRIPLLAAFSEIEAQDLIDDAARILPPQSDYMLVFIGGGQDPRDVLDGIEVCELPLNTFLRNCL